MKKILLYLLALTLLINLPESVPAQTLQPEAFTFVRIKYNSGKFSYGFRLRFQMWDSWEVDYPTAEENFISVFEEVTKLPATDQALAVGLTDPQLFDHSFAYILEVGYMQLSQAEADSLREWCLRGGFLMIDDFHGTAQWENFLYEFGKVFPDRQPVRLRPDHPVFHCYFDFDQAPPPVPGLGPVIRGTTYESDGIEPQCWGFFDDKNRLMVLVNFNVDIGDSWEHSADPKYPKKYSLVGHRLGINYVIYAMTH
ncbi:DUF4159 domain-containing protein [bacterium]|nr:DUF4159 domain-containing protein [bacterium]